VVDPSGRVVFQKIYGWEEVPPLDEVWPLLERL
jgi:hypothetical protein